VADKHYAMAMANQLSEMFKKSGGDIVQPPAEESDGTVVFSMIDPMGNKVQITVESLDA